MSQSHQENGGNDLTPSDKKEKTNELEGSEKLILMQ